MLIELDQYKKQKFRQVAEKIMAAPQFYLAFDSVSDFYKASWLDQFPQGTIWLATGLDNGAEEFMAIISYRELYLKIICNDQPSAQLGERKSSNKKC